MNDDIIQKEPTLPSTIIDCTGDKLVVVRQGAFVLPLALSVFTK
jgi:tRNA A37 threonylcarbamoyladenosine synthetase subunit TsaC/SUA5/YrdC